MKNVNYKLTKLWNKLTDYMENDPDISEKECDELFDTVFSITKTLNYFKDYSAKELLEIVVIYKTMGSFGTDYKDGFTDGVRETCIEFEKAQLKPVEKVIQTMMETDSTKAEINYSFPNVEDKWRLKRG